MLSIPQNLTGFSIYLTTADSAVADVILYDANNQTGLTKIEETNLLHAAARFDDRNTDVDTFP
jgi:hypothetical protein